MKISPFKAIRPVRDKVHLVSTRSVVSYKKRIINAKLEENPFTFLHIIKPEYGEKSTTKPNSPARLKKIKGKFDQFVDEKTFIQDDKASFYIYRQQRDEHIYTGIIVGAAVEDYINGNIKIHEQTLTKREQIFKNYLKICRFNAEPVLLTHPKNDEVSTILKTQTELQSEYDFTTVDRVRHTLWVINNDAIIEQIRTVFDKIENLYIADGHHRTSSSVLLCKDLKKENKEDTPIAPYHSFLSYIISEDQVKIYDFNRVVTDLNGHTVNSFLDAVAHNFEFITSSEARITPNELHEVSMYINDIWYLLKIKTELVTESDPVGCLDTHLLTKYLLSPVLGIKDLRTDNRIDFIGGHKGLDSLQQRVDKRGAKVAFATCPITIEQLKNVADTNNIMPPKSTWIEPKLRSGITIYKI